MIGIAGPANHEWLTAHGINPVAYGDSLADRLREAGIDAFIDTHGSGYVKLAIDLGVAPKRIDTVIDFAAAQQYGVKAEGGVAALSGALLAETRSDGCRWSAGSAHRRDLPLLADMHTLRTNCFAQGHTPGQ